MEIIDFLELNKKIKLIDVRSPTEYDQGHIPTAINYPLFTDEERKAIGTAYKREGKEMAVLKGLKLIGKNLDRFAEGLLNLSKNEELVFHCWRGGMRSSSVGWLSNLVGIKTIILKGGYKSYRQFIKEFMKNSSFRIKILGGPTGSKKTILLNKLKELGEQIIDLEALAHHKGSAFGFLGELEQPSVEQFENNLFEALWRLDPLKTIWIENESKSIGRVYIPDEFWQKMNEAPITFIDFEKEDRIQFLVEEYSKFGNKSLEAAFEKIVKRLGGQNLKLALKYLAEENYYAAADVALTYYDKAYKNSLSKQKGKIEKTILASGLQMSQILREIIG
jgi:tRNA 2-selenouridine synthase